MKTRYLQRTPLCTIIFVEDYPLCSMSKSTRFLGEDLKNSLICLCHSYTSEMGCKKSHINKTLDGYTFEEVRKQSNCIRIFKMEKANGENCQISFFKPANAWIVCSKNVSIICRNEADTALYKESRHQLAILIA